MINSKYYNDIKKFPTQFADGFNLSRNLKLDGNFDRVVLCGMGGSSSFVDFLNDYFATFTPFRMNVVKGYTLPNYTDENTLVLIASYSGNTEETLSCLEETVKKGFKYCIITAGGKLLEHAKASNSPLIQIPTGIQPRLCTGYFIGSILMLLINLKLIPNVEEEVEEAASTITQGLEEDKAIDLAKRLNGKVPVIYAEDHNSSIALLSKIKFNENSKTQSFWNYFSELNHNEMIGFTTLVMKPLFIICKSKFGHPRQVKRIEVFMQLMKQRNAESYIIEMRGKNVLEEMLSVYYFIDHVTFYLAEEYGVDPEPVPMVEEFKKMI